MALTVIYLIAVLIALGMIVKLIIHFKCKHEWKIIGNVKVEDKNIFGYENYERCYLCCKKCGKLKIRNMK